jgi:hypothetical protein
MGYMLPIQQYEYEQYHRRKLNYGPSPFYINSLHPVSFHQYIKDYNTKIKGFTENRNRPNVKQANKYKINPKVLAEITGKGQYFNEII